MGGRMFSSLSKFAISSLAAGLTLLGVDSASAATTFDTSLVSPPGVYFGAGNEGTNGHWTVNTERNVELGLIAIQRGMGNVYTPVGNVYNVPLGADPTNSTRAIWNFNFSINLQATGIIPDPNELTLGDVTATLSVHDVVKNVTNSFNPNAFGDNSAYAADGSTRNGNVAGQQATDADVGMQNSENLTFFPYGLTFDMNLDNTYLIALSLIENESGDSLGSVDIVVVAGTGAPVPVPAALPLFASGLGVIGFAAVRRRKRKAAA